MSAIKVSGFYYVVFNLEDVTTVIIQRFATFLKFFCICRVNIKHFDPKLEGHVVFLNSNAGFLPETFPADLKEVVIKMFLIKKKEFIKNINHEETEITEFPLDVQKIIHSYKRKSL